MREFICKYSGFWPLKVKNALEDVIYHWHLSHSQKMFYTSAKKKIMKQKETLTSSMST